MLTCPYLLHALSPLHAGTGQAADVVDLPIARMRSTGIPILPGSSVKGVLRDARTPPNQKDSQELAAVFGPNPEQDAATHAGALIVGDARLLALPVRSFKGVFAWVTSPLLLELARRDMEQGQIKDLPQTLPQPTDNQALVANLQNSENLASDNKIYLEELDLSVEAAASVGQWAELMAPWMTTGGSSDWFSKRLVVVHDEVMAFLWETATQIDTRIRIDSNTRTAAKGALWVEESLPPETLLLGLLAADRSRRQGHTMTAQAVMAFALPQEAILQFGGKATVGRGRCRMLRLPCPPREA